jgi:hypothetical protein
MRSFFYLIIIFIFQFSLAQQRYTISGTITEDKTNETFFGVSVYVVETKTGGLTNEYGFYSLTLPEGEYTLRVSYLGFNTEERKVVLNNNQKINFSLIEASNQLEEVIIKSEKNFTDVKKPEMSTNRLTMTEIKKIPVILGEVDVIKSLLLLPGVTNAGEAASGFNVRGGSADQNLILLDEATIFNSSHLFGFFSVFNPDAIKDLKLYKGGIPARFGGRLSSVLEIYQKEGNSKKHEINGGIGLLASRLLAEGPIVKDKTSYLVAGRASYAHLFLKFTDNENSAYFYDLNTKISHKFNDKNRLYFSGYFGRDVFSIAESFENVYGNSVINLRWNHLFNDKLFANTSLIYSDYYYGLTLDFVGFNWNSGIKNYNLKYDLRHYLSDKTKLQYGLNSIYYQFNPGTIEPIDENSSINFRRLDQKYAFENAIYFDLEQQLTPKLNASVGMRFSTFHRLGAQNVNLYENNQAVVFNQDLKVYEEATPIGQKSFGSNEVINSYNNFEPRAALAYTINDDKSIKASYNRMTQYLHLISNTASPTPLDIWSPSGDFFEPMLSDQVAIGYFTNLNNKKYSLEIETYYKTIKNKVDFIDGAELIANNAIEQVVLNGEGRAYGLELYLKKNEGKLQGWISYTLARSEQRIPGRDASEPGINNGNWYVTGYDKTHNLSTTATYKINDKWTFGGVFTFQSGQPITYPVGQFNYQGFSAPVFGDRNAFRRPEFHHLDVSATLTPRKNANRKWQGEWVFSIYNVYNRKNAANITFRQNDQTLRNEAVRLSIFGMIPSVTYNFKF